MKKFTPEGLALKLNSFTPEGQKATRRAMDSTALIAVVAAQTYGRARVKKGPRFRTEWVTKKSVMGGDRVSVFARFGFAYLSDLGSYKQPSGFKTFGPNYVGEAFHPPIKAQPWFYEGVESIPDSVISSKFASEMTSTIGKHF